MALSDLRESSPIITKGDNKHLDTVKVKPRLGAIGNSITMKNQKFRVIQKERYTFSF